MLDSNLLTVNIFRPKMASSPPMISAPTLVTSTTNLVTATPPSSNSGSSAGEDWRCKYLEAKDNCRKLKTQMREQAKKSRQLILAVKTKLQDEESEKAKVTYWAYSGWKSPQKSHLTNFLKRSEGGRRLTERSVFKFFFRKLAVL